MNDRNENIFLAYDQGNGETMKSLAKRYGLGVMRIWQIIHEESEKRGLKMIAKRRGGKPFQLSNKPHKESPWLNTAQIPQELITKFKGICEKKGVTVNWQLMEIIKKWTGENNDL